MASLRRIRRNDANKRIRQSKLKRFHFVDKLLNFQRNRFNIKDNPILKNWKHKKVQEKRVEVKFKKNYYFKKVSEIGVKYFDTNRKYIGKGELTLGRKAIKSVLRNNRISDRYKGFKKSYKRKFISAFKIFYYRKKRLSGRCFWIIKMYVN